MLDLFNAFYATLPDADTNATQSEEREKRKRIEESDILELLKAKWLIGRPLDFDQ